MSTALLTKKAINNPFKLLLIRVKIYLTNQRNSAILSILGEQHERIQDFNRSNPPP